ncbi:hypothetical protein HZP84_08740 [Elizabethkingia anophelis]|nr:hypothetical protein [Elizabethkingia anophelis]MCT3693387.1 hypothetical protein [Elizabethkingia anophelis]MCT3824855.1 hypothetical protein [Elizabethkingia anophelis]MCT3932313.1 hypothetical protein [Elizabethkingia anophelis]MCT4078432.1 hypothetical protein [Elizabethkingia anophelis]MCT4080218.1 hypothetical protein [Elizabethkingia anophelis]
MKNDIYSYLKFRLGEEYCNFEFEVIPLPPYEILENSLILEPYEYFGEISEIFEIRVKHIILYFNADILMKVELKFIEDRTAKIKMAIETLGDIILPNTLNLYLSYDKITNFTSLVYESKNI